MLFQERIPADDDEGFPAGGPTNRKDVDQVWGPGSPELIEGHLESGGVTIPLPAGGRLKRHTVTPAVVLEESNR